MEMQKVQAHLIRIPSANHLPTEQRCPAFLMPQKLNTPEPQALYPSPSDIQSAENIQKSSHITGKIVLLCTVVYNSVSRQQPQQSLCFISPPQPSNGLTNNWDICGVLESTSLSLGAQQGSYAIQEVIMHSTSSFTNKTKPHSFYTAHKLKKIYISGKDCFAWKKEKMQQKSTE